jgi:proteasome beta subunit
MRTVYKEDLTGDEAADVAIKALVAASQEDTATGGPDLRRGIYPTVLDISAEGVRELDDSVVAPIAEDAVESIR